MQFDDICLYDIISAHIKDINLYKQTQQIDAKNPGEKILIKKEKPTKQIECFDDLEFLVARLIMQKTTKLYKLERYVQEISDEAKERIENN